MMVIISKTTILVMLLCLLHFHAKPQSCGCTFTIDKEGVHDGKDLGVKAGDVVCVKAGKYNHLRFVNFIGSTLQPIVIKNCGGQVLVEHNSYWGGLEFYNSKYVRATGSGDSNFKYGFKINILSSTPDGVVIGELSTNFELDHIEVMKAGFAGVMAKTDPRCDLTANRPNFAMNDVSIHDNYIHDTGGEGFYIGHSFYSGFVARDAACKGTILYPHEIHKLRVFNNITNNTGCEGIQVGCATNDVEIYNNRVSNYGIDPFALYQNNGIQLSEGTTGRLYNNFIINGEDTVMNRTTGAGIIMFPYGGNYVYNNVVVNFMTSGIMLDNRDGTVSKSLIVIANNTFVTKNKKGSEGIRLYSEITNNKIYNNIIVGAEFPIKYLTATALAEEKNNYYSKSIKPVNFEDSLKNNFQLKPGSPCIDAGVDVSLWGINTDYLKATRPARTAYDIGAYECPLVYTDLGDEKQSGIRIYPTPAFDFLTVDVSALPEHEAFRVSIFDLYGRELYLGSINESILNIPLANYPSGIYVVRCFSKTLTYNHKFTKK